MLLVMIHYNAKSLIMIMCLCFCSDKSPIKYFSDYSNILNIFAVLVTVLIVPFRFANLEFQWVFAAIAYILHSLRIFEYAVIMA